MKTINFLLVCSLVLVQNLVYGAVATQLTMQDAVNHALANRPDLEALSFATQASKSGAKAAIAGYYPNITLTSDFDRTNGQGKLQNTTMLGVNQHIYSFSGPQQLYKKAKKQAELAELDEDTQKNLVRLTVERAFLGAFLLQEQRKVVDAQYKASQAMFKRSSRENKEKLLDKDVWLTSAETFASNVSDVYKFSNALDSTYRTLEFLTGQKLLSEMHVQGKNDVKAERARLLWDCKQRIDVQPLEVYYDNALRYRPEIKQAVKRAEIERANVHIARGKRLPVLSASAMTGYAEKDTVVELNEKIVSGDKGYWTVNAHLSWNVFDGLVTQYEEQQAEANRVKEMLNKQQKVLDIKQEVQECYRNFVDALIQRKSQKVSYVRAHNAFVLSQKKYKIGKIAFNEFKSAEALWCSEQFNWIKSTVNVALQERTLHCACGYPENNEK